MLSNDIEVEVTPLDRAGEYEVRVIRAASGGEPRASLRLDVPRMLGMRGTLESTVLASAAHARSGRVPEEERPLRDAGQELFDGLFTGAVRETYRSSVALARDHGTRLRVVLHLEAPELAALPWEAMWDPQEHAYLCRKEPLVRHVPALYTPDPLPVTPPLRILGVVASPRGLPTLDVERERGLLEKALERAVADGRIRLDWLQGGTWDALQDHLLNSACHVLHFIGHGDYDPDLDQGRVALVNEDDGRADWVEADRLIDLLNEADPTPRLVVLNSCSSGQSGTQDPLSGTASVLVHGGVSAVAAMQFRISDPAAVAFPRGFYKALAAGKSVEAALSSGRIAILGRGESLEWVTPVLYMRGGATQLFTIAPPTPAPQRAGEPAPGDDQAPDPGVPEPADQSQPAHPGAEQQPHPGLSTATGGVAADPDWNDALEAYFTEEWAAARDLLTSIVARHPGDPKAGDMLRHAQQRADLVQWYAHAQDAATAGDWPQAATALDRIVQAEPGYRDAAEQLEKARWQQRRASLIDDVHRLHAAERWQAVLAAGGDLAELDPDTPDPDGMISHARQALADLDLADRYAQGLHQLENGDRAAALATFTSIEQERPAYRNTPALLETLNHPPHDDQAPAQHQKPDDQAATAPGPPTPTHREAPTTGEPAVATRVERQPPAGSSAPTPNTRKRRAALTALIAILLLLGTGGIWLLSSNGEGNTEAEGIAAPGTTLKVWLMPPGQPDSIIDAVNAKFNETHPNVEVQVEVQEFPGGDPVNVREKLTNSLGTDATPDVVEIYNTWTAEYSAAGLLAELDPSTFGVEGMLPGLQSSGELDGARYGIPYYGSVYNGSVRIVVYKKSDFEMAGVEVPTSLEELDAVAAKLQESNKDNARYSAFYFPGKDWYSAVSFVWDAGGEIATQDGSGTWTGTLNSAESVKGLTTLKALVDNYSKAPKDRDEWARPDAFIAGNVGMLIAPWWAVQDLDEPDSKFAGDIGVFALPGTTVGSTSPVFFGGSDLAVSAESAKQGLGVEWIEIFTGLEMQTQLVKHGVIPNQERAFVGHVDVDPFLEVAYLASANSGFVPVSPNWANVEDSQVLQDMLVKIFSGAATIEAATTEASEAITATLNG